MVLLVVVANLMGVASGMLGNAETSFWIAVGPTGSELRAWSRRSGANVVLGAALAACMSSACETQEKATKPKAPPQVGYVIVQSTSVSLTTELAGRVAAMQSSEVRPQVSGVIRHRFFKEGSFVQSGQTLYEIDTRLYRAAFDEARANLRSAQASARAAQMLVERYRPLAEAEAVAQQDYTNAIAQAEQAQALVGQTRARLETTRVNLQFTRVPAPITGRIGRSLFTEGALASANQTQPLAVIQRLDPVFIDVQRSSAELLALRRSLADNGMAAGSAAVRLTLEDGTAYDQLGTIEFSEVMVNQATGTVTLRAQFPNPEGVLLPGMFVRAVLTKAVSTRAFLVPQQAVRRDAKGEASVFIVGEGNKAVQRAIVTTQTQGDAWVVTTGLNPGDKVITQGLDNTRPGVAIKPVAASTPQLVEPSELADGQSAGRG